MEVSIKGWQIYHELMITLCLAKADAECIKRFNKVKSEAGRKAMFIVEYDRKLVELTEKWFN